MGLINAAVLREVLSSLLPNDLLLCIGRKVKLHSGQHCHATGRTGRATDFRQGIGISTVPGLLSNLKAREPLLVANRIQISMPNHGPTLLSSSPIFTGSPQRDTLLSAPSRSSGTSGKPFFLKNANHALAWASDCTGKRKRERGRHCR